MKTPCLVALAAVWSAGFFPADAHPPPPASPPVHSTDGFVPLFNGTDLTNWDTYLDGLGVGNDPDGIFKIENGQIHLLDLPEFGPGSPSQPFGYLATNDDYRNYRLRFQYMWGTKKYEPRATAPRTSGLLYHWASTTDAVWPTSVECQVQEAGTGDLFLLGGSRGDFTVVAPGNNTYQPGGFQLGDTDSSISKSAPFDLLTGWNTVEAIVTGDEGIHVVNGRVNNRGTNYTWGGQPLTEGKISLQVEGAEVFYRDIEVQPLFSTGGGPTYRVLVFSNTEFGFRHENIEEGIAAIEMLGARNGFEVDATEDTSQFTDANLAQYTCVIFLNPSGNPFENEEKAAFERYIRNGGGFVGLHGASFTEDGWIWYHQLLGSVYLSAPGNQWAELDLIDLGHPSTESIDTRWRHFDEWYDFDPNPADNPNIRILAKVDQTSYTGGAMPADGSATRGNHPITWCQEFDGGRSWYTALGHPEGVFSSPHFLMHLLGGIEWAAGKSREPTSDKTVLFGGTDLSNWSKLGGGAAGWAVTTDSMEVVPGQGNIVTNQEFDDFRLHLEFRPNSTAPGTPEQNAGNSGVYLQSRYEIQVLDSFHHPLDGRNDCGAIYNVRNASSNRALPADAWQHYDIWFRAPRYVGGVKTENARVTVFWNGIRVHDSVEIPGSTAAGEAEVPPATDGPASGPLMLQDHDASSRVRYRNIWVEPGAALPPLLDAFIEVSDVSYDSTSQEVTLAWTSGLAGPFTILAGDAADLTALHDPGTSFLPITAATGVTSPATFPVPASLQGEPEVFFQVMGN